MLDNKEIYDSCEPLIKLVESTNAKQWTQGAVHRGFEDGKPETSCMLGHIQRLAHEQGESSLQQAQAYTSVYGKRANELFVKFNTKVLSKKNKYGVVGGDRGDYSSIPCVNDTCKFIVPGTDLHIYDNPRANILSILYTMRSHDMAAFMGELESMAANCTIPEVTLDNLLDRPVSVAASSAACEADLQPLDFVDCVQVQADLSPEQMFHVEQNR